MSDAPTGETCGTCKFAQRSFHGGDINAIDCFGNPPSVHVLGITPDALNRPQIQMEAFVPRVAANRPACSLYKFKPQIMDLSKLRPAGTN